MANIKYFSDFGGNTVEMTNVSQIKNAEFVARFPGVKGIRVDSFSMRVGYVNGTMLPMTRVIEYKKQPSLHVCNGKCVNGKRNGCCECQCGGKNHGRGMFTSLQ